MKVSPLAESPAGPLMTVIAPHLTTAFYAGNPGLHSRRSTFSRTFLPCRSYETPAGRQNAGGRIPDEKPRQIP